MDGLASYLAGQGYEGLTFDFVGHKLGATGGELHAMAQIPANLLQALNWLENHSAARRIVLVGHSMGAAAALAVAAAEGGRRDSRLAGIACLCIGTDPSHGFHGLIGQTMLTQRADYIAGAPASELIRELDSLVLSARNISRPCPRCLSPPGRTFSFPFPAWRPSPRSPPIPRWKFSTRLISKRLTAPAPRSSAGCRKHCFEL